MDNKYLEKIAGLLSRVGGFAKKVTGENVRNIETAIKSKKNHVNDIIRESAERKKSDVDFYNKAGLRSKVFDAHDAHAAFSDRIHIGHDSVKWKDDFNLVSAKYDRSNARKQLATGVAAATGVGGLSLAAKKYLNKNKNKDND